MAESSVTQLTTKPTKMRFRKIKVLLACAITCTGLMVATNATAQDQIEVTGVVLDESEGPVVGASVVLKGTTFGTITDANGNFMLKADLNDVLQISYTGYITEDVTVTGEPIKMYLMPDLIGLSEVIVIGYGVQKKKLSTGATVQVGSNEISRVNGVDAFDALQSQTPGVSITQNSGQPGDGYKVIIRGLGTTGSSTPLYVIDGVAGGSIEALDPNDIESVDVLKDAASAAIYGARAANGVVLVTTKHGKAGKVIVTYDGYYGVQNAVTNDVKPLNAKQYMEIIDKASISAGTQPYGYDTLIPAQYQQIMNGTWNGTNWLDRSLNKNAPIQSHSVNVSGGSDLSRFALGFSYFQQEGTLGNPAVPLYERYTTRINTDYSIWKKNDRDIIKIGENATLTMTNKSGLNLGGIYNNNIRNLLTTTPLLPELNSEGDYYQYKDMAADGWDWDQTSINPLAQIRDQHGNKNTKTHRLQFNAFLEFEPIAGLKYRTNAGFQYFQSDYRSYLPSYEWSIDKQETRDFTEQKQSWNTSWTWENTINYVKQIDNHNFDVLIGQSVEKWGYGSSVGAKNANSLFPNSFSHAYIDNTQGISGENTSINGAPNTNGALASFFGRVNYNFNETYMASFVLRADGSANFAEGKRWGYFPSVSAGWVVTNEDFATPVTNVLNFFKLRGSWGQNGNADIDNFQYLATIAFNHDSQYFFNDKTNPSTGLYPDIMANPDVSWETSEQINLGFDARLFDSRLQLNFDWYKKTTKDWLVVAPQLASYGTGAPYINGGDVENKGFEIAVKWSDNINDLKYTIGVNLSHNKNKVTRIANEEGIIHGPEHVLAQNTDELYRVEEGKPMGYFWGYKIDGVFQNQNQIDKYIAEGKPYLQDSLVPGDLIFRDNNGDGKIDVKDKTEIGNPHPDFNLGINLTLEYKGFDFTLNAYGMYGHQIAKSYRSFSDKPNHNYTTEVYSKYWTGEGSTNRYPRFTDGKNTNMKEISQLYIEDANFLKISNITLGYDLKHIWKNLPLQKVRLYISGQNLFTFTDYSGMDPEVGYGDNENWAGGIDLGYYPNPRTILGGLNITF